jgi:hypothetical protein
VAAAFAGYYFLRNRDELPKTVTPAAARSAPATLSPPPVPPVSETAPPRTPLPATPLPPTPEPTAAPTKKPDSPVSVTFESNSNARLSVDGKTYHGLPAPVRVSLKPGRHVAVFEVPNYQKKQESFEVRAGEAPAPIRVNFEAWGILDIGSEPPGAKVTIDGKTVGTTPFKKPFAVGMHAIEVSLPGYEPAADARQVAELSSTKAFFRLKKSS